MSNRSFFDGAVYVRDNVLATLIGLQNELGHGDPNNPEYQAYKKVYDSIADKMGDMFDEFKM